MKTLFEISEEMTFIDAFLMDTGGDVTDEQVEAEIDKWLSELGNERDAKIDNYCALIKEYEAKAEARSKEAARIADLGRVDQNAADRLKARLLFFFQAHKIDKIETLRFKVGRQKNGGALAIILDEAVALDPKNAPERYQEVRTIYALRRDLLAEDLKVLEQVREKAESYQKTWEALKETIEALRVKVDHDPEDEEAKTELASATALFDQNKEEYETAQKDYYELLEATKFAHFAERGEHLRIR